MSQYVSDRDMQNRVRYAAQLFLPIGMERRRLILVPTIKLGEWEEKGELVSPSTSFRGSN